MNGTGRPAGATAAVALALAALVGCSSDTARNSTTDSFDLRHDDPAGFVACRDVGLAEMTDDEAERSSLLDAAATLAAAAESGPIRDTVSQSDETEAPRETSAPESGEYTVEPADLRAACEEVGFDFALLED